MSKRRRETAAINEALRAIFEDKVPEELARLKAADDAHKRGLLAPLRPPED